MAKKPNKAKRAPVTGRGATVQAEQTVTAATAADNKQAASAAPTSPTSPTSVSAAPPTTPAAAQTRAPERRPPATPTPRGRVAAPAGRTEVQKPAASVRPAAVAAEPPASPAVQADAPRQAERQGGDGARVEPEEVAVAPQPAAPEPPPAPPQTAAPAIEAAPAEPESVQVREPVPFDEPPPASGPVVQPRPSLYVVHFTPEMAPVAKVGGLADVVFGLSRELAIRGNHVEIILPKYDNLRYDQIFELHEVYQDLWVPWYDAAIHCTVFFGHVYDRKCYFIEPHSQDNFFNRGAIYGFGDDVLRFAFFARAAMEFLWKSGRQPDVIHCHDWQTALAPVFLYEIYQRLGMTHSRACLTIHNFKHQGVTGLEMLRATGLHHPEHFFDANRMRDNQNPQALNLLKAGIVYSNFVTTVSPRYAFETKNEGQGFGLEPTLHTHQLKYGGVVNGIDYDVWNPEVDRHIPVRYGVDSIDRKYDNKRVLRQRVMIADNDKPIVAFIGRLDPQKGLGLVRHAIFSTLEKGAQFVLLGSSPDQAINADFWGLKQMLNESPDCHLEIGFDEELAHLIYAGADMMLVPSKFEPCGLTQLIALRYGTIPVVRSVGGLADTVFDKDHSDRPLHERNGYAFKDYDDAGLESALGRAIACYFNHPDHFRNLIGNAMRSDFSWNGPGQDYLNIYDYIRNH